MTHSHYIVCIRGTLGINTTYGGHLIVTWSQVDGERRVEVEYVDRDRAAAVVIGTKDIVNDLKNKKRRERMENANAILLEEEVDIETYLAQGEHELK